MVLRVWKESASGVQSVPWRRVRLYMAVCLWWKVCLWSTVCLWRSQSVYGPLEAHLLQIQMYSFKILISVALNFVITCYSKLCHGLIFNKDIVP